MATVQYGSIITEMRGSIGGIIFQKSGTQLTARLKNPCRSQFKNSLNAVSSSILKNRLAQVASSWRNLTPTEQAAYATAAPSFPFYNRYGVSYTPSAFQLFCWQNVNRLELGASLLTTAPSPETQPDFSGLSLTVDAVSNFTLAWTTEAAASWYISAFFTTGFSAGKALNNSALKQLALTNIGGLSSKNYFAGYVNKLGTPVTGNKYQMRFRAIYKPNGQATAYYTATAICT